MKKQIFSLSFVAFLSLVAIPSDAAIRTYDGIVMQVNPGDNSFTMRLRDGSMLTAKNPVVAGNFISIKGNFDDVKKIVDKTTYLTLKEMNGPDAIPAITVTDPGSGEVGTTVTLSGTGFTKKNSIWIGDVPYAVMNLAKKNDKLTFMFPPIPCNQKAKASCPKVVTSPGRYDLKVANENGISNPVAFQVLPLPPLSIITDTVPQVVGGTRYKAAISGIGGAEGYIWRVTDGLLPPGIMFAQAACKGTPCKTEGVLSGTPTVPGSYNFTITLTSGQENVSRQFLLVVVPPIGTGWR